LMSLSKIRPPGSQARRPPCATPHPVRRTTPPLSPNGRGCRLGRRRRAIHDYTSGRRPRGSASDRQPRGGHVHRLVEHPAGGGCGRDGYRGPRPSAGQHRGRDVVADHAPLGGVGQPGQRHRPSHLGRRTPTGASVGQRHIADAELTGGRRAGRGRIEVIGQADAARAPELERSTPRPGMEWSTVLEVASIGTRPRGCCSSYSAWPVLSSRSWSWPCWSRWWSGFVGPG
jgi:hypothetical protein